MRDTIFLVCHSGGVIRTTKNPPKLDRGQIAVEVVVSVPDEAFTAPYPVIHVDVPATLAKHPAIEAYATDSSSDDMEG